jgi:tetratricopeptide (TPR) repeat protein
VGTQILSLTRGGPKRIRLTWGTFWNNLKVDMDGQEILNFRNKQELQTGKTFDLADGSKLMVVLDKNKLYVARNSRPLPGSAFDNTRKHSSATGAVVFVSILSILLGLLGNSMRDIQESTGAGTISLIGGVVFGILSIFVSKRSRTSLWIAIILYGLDTLLLVLVVFNGGTQFIVGIVVHIALLVAMYQGFEGMDALDYDESISLREAALLPLSPNKTDLLQQAVQLLKSGGDRQRARQLIDQVLKLDPNNTDALYLAAYIADGQDQKISLLQKLLVVSPHHIGAKKAITAMQDNRPMDMPA